MISDHSVRQWSKLSTSAGTIERDYGSSESHRVDTAYEIYLGLYQSLTGPEERQKIFRTLSPRFFDLIVIDECHRGSAAEDSAWREIWSISLLPHRLA